MIDRRIPRAFVWISINSSEHVQQTHSAVAERPAAGTTLSRASVCFCLSFSNQEEADQVEKAVNYLLRVGYG